jgi:hypothetical protein
MIEVDSVMVPIHSPGTPPPAESEKWSDGESDSEVNSRPSPPNARNVDPIRPRRDGISVDKPGIIRRNINDIRIRRRDIDLALVILHIELLG